jgi:hypothetical protein
MINRATELTEARITFIRVGGYADQHSYPLSPLHASQRLLNEVNNLKERPDFEKSLIAHLVKEHVHFDNEAPERKVAIPGGWDAPRYAFVLEVPLNAHIGYHLSSTIQLVAGYTDPVPRGEEPNDKTKLYFNRSVIQQRMKVMGPTGIEEMAKISHDTLILNGEQRDRLLRPSDVFGVLRTMALVDRLHQGGMAPDIMDTTTMIAGSRLKSTAAANENLKHWFTSVVQSVINAKQEDHPIFEGTPEDLYSNALSHCHDAPISQDPMFSALYASTGFDYDNSVLLQDIKDLFPKDFVKVIQAERESADCLRGAEGCSEVSAANRAISCFSGIMSLHGVRTCMVQVIDRVVQINQIGGFGLSIPDRDLQAFHEHLSEELPVLLGYDTAPMHFSIDIDLFTEANVQIYYPPAGLRDGPNLPVITPITTTRPMFASGLWSSLITRDNTHQEQMADDFKYLIGQL